MPHNRFFTLDDLSEGQQVTLEGPEMHHLSVMRPKVGEDIELVNGKNVLATACIESIEKKRIQLKVNQIERKEPTRPKVILAQALPQVAKLDFIIEKGTELNTDEFWLFPGVLSDKTDLTNNQRSRLDHLAISALKQCGRLDLPQIHILPALKDWQKPEGNLFYGDPRGTMMAQKCEGPTILFIGPEKGFNPSEIEILKNWNAQGIKLHENVLRTETAAVAALSALSVGLVSFL